MKLSEIRLFLSDKKWNIAEVARKTGLNYFQVRNVLLGKNPPVLNVEKVSDFIQNQVTEYKKVGE